MAAPVSVLTVAGTSYTAAQRSAAHLSLSELSRDLDGGYDALAFAELSLSPTPAFRNSQAASLTVDIGSGAVIYFAGRITDVQSRQGRAGWIHGYTCAGLKFLADRAPVTAVDGTGTQVYNRRPEDPYYLASDAGLATGTIISRILTLPAVAQALNAVGVGNYTGLPSAPVLDAATVADLALLTVVPPEPVILQGEALFNTLEQMLARWMPTWTLEIQPDGVIRAKDTTDTTTFVPRTVTVGSDPATWPTVRRSTHNCATRLVLRGGPEVEAAMLSQVDGTLAEVFTGTDKTSWNLTYFTSPKGATDYGTVTATTSTSATLRSHDATLTWATNFWANNNGHLTLINPVASGISESEARLVTANVALTAGSTASASWDPSWPISASGYTLYRLAGSAGGLVDTWRTYQPREPNTGAVGLSTYIGAHLVSYSPKEVRWGNNTRTLGTHVPVMTVVSGTGLALPIGVEPVPSAGMFRATQPTVTVYGKASFLNTGSPTTTADGKPADVQVLALYSRGALSVTVPPDVSGVPQYEGTAYTEDGLEVTKYLDYPDWMWAADTGSMTTLAQQHLDAMKDAEVDIALDWYMGANLTMPAWDFLAFGYSLNVDIDGATSPWSALNAPVRSIRLRWASGAEGKTHALTIAGSTRRKPFSGDSLYLHPQYRSATPLGSLQGEGFTPGVGAMLGMQVAGMLGGVTGMGATPGSMAPANLAGDAFGGLTATDALMAGMDNGSGVFDMATAPGRISGPTPSLRGRDQADAIARWTRQVQAETRAETLKQFEPFKDVGPKPDPSFLPNRQEEPPEVTRAAQDRTNRETADRGRIAQSNAARAQQAAEERSAIAARNAERERRANEERSAIEDRNEQAAEGG
jgi:hypothetical protein